MSTRIEEVKEAIKHFELYGFLPLNMQGDVVSVAKIPLSVAKGMPEEQEHSPDCLYMKEPRYKDNPAKEKYCNCGALEHNQALSDCQVALTNYFAEMPKIIGLVIRKHLLEGNDRSDLVGRYSKEIATALRKAWGER